MYKSNNILVIDAIGGGLDFNAHSLLEIFFNCIDKC